MSRTYCPFLAVAALLAAGATAFPAATARDVFDDSIVHEVSLDLDPDDWAALRENYTENTYYRAQFWWGEESLEVGVRSRGRGSRSPIKPNILVNFPRHVSGQRFAGLRRLVLNACNQDASAMRQWIAFRLFQRMGLPAPRQSFARVHINGQYFGFYAMVENIDQEFLERNFGESGGYLYEWEPNDFYHFEWLGEDPEQYSPRLLDPQTRENDPDIQPFIELVRAINFVPDSEFVEEVARYLNPRLYLTHAAIENALSEIDGIWGLYGMNNFSLYRFEGQPLSQMIAWDKDLTFRWSERGIFDGVEDNLLARRLMGIPEYRTAYLSAVVKAATLLGGEGGWADLTIAGQYELIREAATDDPHKQCIIEGGSLTSCGPEEFEAEVKDLHVFLAERQLFVLAQVADSGYEAPAGEWPLLRAAGAVDGSRSEVAPGSLAAVAGERLSAAEESAAGTPLPRILGDTFVAINGVRAPLLLAAEEQANFQIPWDIPSGAASIAVAVDGWLSDTLEVPVAAAAPVIFAVAHADGLPVSEDAPGAGGEVVVLWMTGLGEVNATPVDGAAPEAGAGLETLVAPRILVDEREARVDYAGLSPGFVGLYQVVFEIPAGLASGTHPLSLAMGEQMAIASLALR
ncbi:MAG: CotH kinase family protein [Bryobacteraceae bacterium]|nr:CotH kinase family protein [Bryobacteraceae bacterium]